MEDPAFYPSDPCGIARHHPGNKKIERDCHKQSKKQQSDLSSEVSHVYPESPFSFWKADLLTSSRT
jgi:hypothetical protein